MQLHIKGLHRPMLSWEWKPRQTDRKRKHQQEKPEKRSKVGKGHEGSRENDRVIEWKKKDRAAEQRERAGWSGHAEQQSRRPRSRSVHHAAAHSHWRLPCAVPLPLPGLRRLGAGQAQGPHWRSGKGDSQVLLRSCLCALHGHVTTPDFAIFQGHQRSLCPCWKKR